MAKVDSKKVYQFGDIIIKQNLIMWLFIPKNWFLKSLNLYTENIDGGNVYIIIVRLSPVPLWITQVRNHVSFFDNWDFRYGNTLAYWWG